MHINVTQKTRQKFNIGKTTSLKLEGIKKLESGLSNGNTNKLQDLVNLNEKARKFSQASFQTINCLFGC